MNNTNATTAMTRHINKNKKKEEEEEEEEEEEDAPQPKQQTDNKTNEIMAGQIRNPTHPPGKDNPPNITNKLLNINDTLTHKYTLLTQQTNQLLQSLKKGDILNIRAKKKFTLTLLEENNVRYNISWLFIISHHEPPWARPCSR